MDKNSVVLIPPVKIKREAPDEDINEFAETAMNELLGWYGYGSNREDSKMSLSCHSHQGSNSSDPESPKYSEGCEWCGKPVDENKSLTSSGATYCSELCFSQSRRANFKKNKTCDWCRHVRHTVSYVDFQDGASQLQFCSDKCLNQYKMHIFCRETRAHLEMHPHIPEESASGGGLITPDLWLRNCKSPELQSSTPPISPKTSENPPQTSPLPLITVAHPSKFMTPNHENLDSTKRQRTKIQKRNRKRCTATITSSPNAKSPPITEIPQDLRVRHTPPTSSFDNLQFRDNQRPSLYGRDPVDFRGPFFNIPNGLTGSHPRFVHPQLLNPSPMPLQPSQPHSGSLLPPTTVLVPYPIMIPLPIPLPIPIPVSSEDLQKLNDAMTKKNTTPTDDTVDLSQKANDVENSRKVEDAAPDDKEDKEISDTTEDSTNEKSIQEEKRTEVVNGMGRPLRKRKRIAIESKLRMMPVKNKKSVPA